MVVVGSRRLELGIRQPLGSASTHTRADHNHQTLCVGHHVCRREVIGCGSYAHFFYVLGQIRSVACSNSSSRPSRTVCRAKTGISAREFFQARSVCPRYRPQPTGTSKEGCSFCGMLFQCHCCSGKRQPPLSGCQPSFDGRPKGRQFFSVLLPLRQLLSRPRATTTSTVYETSRMTPGVLIATPF